MKNTIFFFECGDFVRTPKTFFPVFQQTALTFENYVPHLHEKYETKTITCKTYYMIYKS